MNQVERVLQIAQLENGEYALEKEEIELTNLIQNVVEDMKLAIQNKGGVVRLIGFEHPQKIYGDALHLSNVFRNLIDNALKYNDLNPEIAIAVEDRSKGILLKFSDNGLGISKTNQEMVFEKFQRVGAGNNHSRKGFGLGLCYVKMIIEKHCGTIKLFSELNKGSRFELYLPK